MKNLLRILLAAVLLSHLLFAAMTPPSVITEDETLNTEVLNRYSLVRWVREIRFQIQWKLLLDSALPDDFRERVQLKTEKMLFEGFRQTDLTIPDTAAEDKKKPSATFTVNVHILPSREVLPGGVTYSENIVYFIETSLRQHVRLLANPAIKSRSPVPTWWETSAGVARDSGELELLLLDSIDDSLQRFLRIYEALKKPGSDR